MLTVYVLPDCPFCPRVRAFLDGRGVPYEAVDVSSDEDRLREMVRVSGQMGVPVVSAPDGRVVVGWNGEALAKLLEKNDIE